MRQLRELMRQRTTLVQEPTQAVNRLQKVVASAKLTLAGVVSEVLGVSGRLMLSAIGAGEHDPVARAERARGHLRRNLAPRAHALDGRVQAQHRVLIQAILGHVHCLERALETIDAQVAHGVADCEPELALLQSIPGVQRIAAVTMLAESGPDMDQFASASHAARLVGRRVPS